VRRTLPIQVTGDPQSAAKRVIASCLSGAAVNSSS